jgi:hypothetical protein
MFGDLDAGDIGVDGLRLAAVGVARQRAKGLELARSALHVEQDARPALLAQLVRFRGHHVGPGQRASREGRG